MGFLAVAAPCFAVAAAAGVWWWRRGRGLRSTRQNAAKLQAAEKGAGGGPAALPSDSTSSGRLKSSMSSAGQGPGGAEGGCVGWGGAGRGGVEWGWWVRRWSGAFPGRRSRRQTVSSLCSKRGSLCGWAALLSWVVAASSCPQASSCRPVYPTLPYVQGPPPAQRPPRLRPRPGFHRAQLGSPGHQHCCHCRCSGCYRRRRHPAAASLPD